MADTIEGNRALFDGANDIRNVRPWERSSHMRAAAASGVLVTRSSIESVNGYGRGAAAGVVGSKAVVGALAPK